MLGNEQQRRTWLLAALALGALALLCAVLLPLASALFAAGVASAALHRPHRWLCRVLGGRPGIAAAALTGLLCVGIALPVAGAGLVAAQQADEAIERVTQIIRHEGVEGIEERAPRILRPVVRTLWQEWESLQKLTSDDPSARRGERESRQREPRVRDARQPDPQASSSEGSGQSSDGKASDGKASDGKASGDDSESKPEQAGERTVEEISKTIADGAGMAASFLGQLVGLAVDIGLALVATFLLLAHGDRLLAWTIEHVPLSAMQIERLLVDMRETSNGILASTFLTSLVQTAVAAVGYWIAGVPHVWFVSTLTFLAGLVSGAAPLMCVVALLLAWSDLGWALFLVGWAVLPVNLVENLMRPLIAHGWVRIPASVLFLALIGGVFVFGPLGLLAGPLVVAFFRATTKLLRRHLDSVEGAREAAEQAAGPAGQAR